MNIFNWNNISQDLSDDEKEELKGYYRTYHRKSWAFKKAFKHYKWLKFAGNSVSLLFASGGIASAVATGGITLVVISTVSVFIKGFMEHQSLDLKIHHCQYVFQSYTHILIMIKDMMRSGEFHRSDLITAMTNVDKYVTDNSPIIDKYLKLYDKKYKDTIINNTDNIENICCKVIEDHYDKGSQTIKTH